MPVRVGINGFGRIGRNVFRAGRGAGADIEWVAVNDLTDAKTLAPPAQVRLDPRALPGDGRGRRRRADRVDGDEIKVLAERDPAKLPWGDLGADVVIESTGFFTNREDAAKHLDGGRQEGHHLRAGQGRGHHGRARRQLRRATTRTQHHVISNASCTTNCLAPFAKVAQRHGRHQARPDDDDPRLHGRPAPAGRAAQGPAPRPRRRDQPRSRPRPAPRRPSASCCPSSRASCTASRSARPSRPARSST